MAIKYKAKKRKKFNLGGASVYAPNVMTPGLNTTANTLFQETDPQMQQARVQALEQEKGRLVSESESRANEIEAQKEKDKATVEQNAAQTNAKFDAGFNAASQIIKTGTSGSQLTSAAGKAAKMGKAGSGFKSFASSGAGMGMIADFAGQGIKSISDDKDATTWKGGEVAGDLLSSAGKGAQLGTMVGGPVGTAIGAGLGLAYGTIKGLTGRARARRDKTKMEQKLARKTQKGNREALENFGQQTAMARSGELKTKTYSGYDLGRNTTAKYGGLKRYI